MFRLKHLLFILLLAPLTGHAQVRLPEEIPLALKAGNARELAKHFNEDIELVIDDQEDVYSRKQAEQIITRFFDDHRPVNFRIIHGGGKETSRYAIGNLETEVAVFRVYMLIKVQDSMTLIHQLRIEQEEDEQ